MNKSNYERLKELERKKERLNKFYIEMKRYPHLCLSNVAAKRNPFWEQTDMTKRVSGMPQIIDLPNDIGLMDIVIKAINGEMERIEKEFEELMK